MYSMVGRELADLPQQILYQVTTEIRVIERVISRIYQRDDSKTRACHSESSALKCISCHENKLVLAVL